MGRTKRRWTRQNEARAAGSPRLALLRSRNSAALTTAFKTQTETYQCTIKSLVSKNTPEYLFIDFSSLKKQTSSGHKAHLFRILQMD